MGGGTLRERRQPPVGAGAARVPLPIQKPIMMGRCFSRSAPSGRRAHKKLYLPKKAPLTALRASHEGLRSLRSGRAPPLFLLLEFPSYPQAHLSSHLVSEVAHKVGIWSVRLIEEVISAEGETPLAAGGGERVVDFS